MQKTKDIIQEEATNAIGDKHRCSVALSMGSGKTRVGLLQAVRFYSDSFRMLVVVPRLRTIQEWKDEIDKMSVSYLQEHITFTTYRSFYKCDKDYDFICLDECHSLLYKHDSWLADYKGKVLGLTGTPPRYKKSGAGLMMERYCPLVYEYLTDEAIEDKIINDYRITVHLIELSSKKDYFVKTKRGTGWWTSEKDSYEYWTEKIEEAVTARDIQILRIMRMKAMMEFPSKERFAKKLSGDITDKCLIFANTKDQADRLCINSYHSGNPMSARNYELFCSGEIKKMSCVMQLNDSANMPGLKVGVLLHAYGNEKKASQRVGRLLRLETDDVAIAHILCYKDTIDETWVRSALKDLDTGKITWVDYS